MSKKKVKVEIYCKQVICYKQQKEMSVDEYNSLLKCHGDDVHETRNREQYNLLQAYIDPLDVFDAHNEFTGLEVFLKK